MTEIANELAAEDPVYEDMVLKFAEHFLFIAAAMNGGGPNGMWDEEDGFYYDCCACRTAAPSGSRCAHWSGCSRCARPR